MGLFDKKICDICGDKIGLLGNRKLEDGNMCKNCAKKMSPWLTGRKGYSVAEMKEHLQYREEYSPELLQKAVDEGNVLQHLEDLAINVKDKIEEQKELWLNEDKAYLVALESGNLLEVGRIANAYKELAKDSVYASMVYV